MVVTFHNPGVIVSGHLLSVRDESPFQLIIAPRPTLGLVFTSFPKRDALLGRKMDATHAALLDADHAPERDGLICKIDLTPKYAGVL